MSGVGVGSLAPWWETLKGKCPDGTIGKLCSIERNLEDSRALYELRYPPPDPAAESVRIEAGRIARLKAMNLGKIYWDEDFDTFDAYTPELKRHLDTAMGFAAKPEGKLVMLGNNGTGKNHLAAAILKAVGGVMYTAYDIGARLRRCYGGDGKEWELLDELCGAPLLVVDEIGRTKGSKAELDWFSHMINRRHEGGMPAVFISNCHLECDCPAGNGCVECFENFFNRDAISRIEEDGAIMEFSGGDYRRKIREKGLRGKR